MNSSVILAIVFGLISIAFFMMSVGIASGEYKKEENNVDKAKINLVGSFLMVSVLSFGLCISFIVDLLV